MFSSPLGRRRGDAKDGKEDSVPRRDTKTIEDPVEELSYLFDRVECILQRTKDTHEAAKKSQGSRSTSSAAGRGTRGFFRRGKKDKNSGTLTPTRTLSNSSQQATHDEEPPSEPPRTPNSSRHRPPKTPPSPYANNDEVEKEKRQSKQDAAFVGMDDEECDEVVEIIRRMAELVVIGERVVTTHIAKEEQKRELREKKGWGNDITSEEARNAMADLDMEPGSEQYLPLFDHFFERNGLELLVDIVTGGCFQIKTASSRRVSTGRDEQKSNKEDSSTNETAQQDETQDNNADTAGDSSAADNKEEDMDDSCKSTRSSREESWEREHYRHLPALKVATQAVQSVAILVSNISRATSLYFVLSNNHVNDLIELPLHLYAAAEKKKQEAAGVVVEVATKNFSTPELAELTTHFVTFLKSLAMRMNAETLQFFLKYPQVEDKKNSSNIKEPPQTEESKAKLIEFPLYARALEFCAAHHDSFVRVTAMNICLNTLRLATVTADNDEDEAKTESKTPMCSSPDGVMHNAQPLPFRDRLAISTHTCVPSRVGRLVSPLFTKLAQMWGTCEETFLEMDTCSTEDLAAVSGNSDLSRTSGSKKSPKNSKDGKPVDPQKEKTQRLNAFKDAAATLQDLLLLLDDVLKVGLTALNEQIIEMMLATFVYPLLLQPMLVYFQRLPLDASPAPPVEDPFFSSSPELRTVDFKKVGRASPHVTAPVKTAMFTLASVFHLIKHRPLLRLLYTSLLYPLAPDSSGEVVISSDACVTGRSEKGDLYIRLDKHLVDTENERSSYVFGGEAKSTSDGNPGAERCIFVLSPALADLLSCAGTGKDSIANTRPNPYRLALLQCLEAPLHMSDFRKLAVCTLDAVLSAFDGKFVADTLLGSDVAKLNEQHTNADSVSGSKHMSEAVTAICTTLINGTPGPFGTWKLEFDIIAAHTLLCAIWRNNEAQRMAAQILERRCGQSATLLSEIPARIPTTKHIGSIMNSIFYESGNNTRKNCYDDLFYLSDTGFERFLTSVATASTFDCLCNRGLEAPLLPVELNTFNEHTVMNLGSSSCKNMLKLDAFSNFLNQLCKSKGGLIRDRKLCGFAFSSENGVVDTNECFVEEIKRSIQSSLSPGLCNAVLGSGNSEPAANDLDQPLPGTIIALAGRTAMPCVCEAQASDADGSNSGAKIVVEGVVWQSLYLVFFGSYMVFAEPVAGRAGSGRVVSSCSMARLSVRRDPNNPADPSSPARRLLVSHHWFSKTIPILFVCHQSPKDEEYGPLKRVKMRTSVLDVWFEDDGAAAHAFHSIIFQIETARTRRGDRLLDYLAGPQKYS